MKRRAFFNGGLCLAVFGLACLIYHALLPFPDMAEVRTKLDYFSRHRDEFDAVFIGSSRIYHQVLPELFDRTAQEGGRKIRSFNFGIDALVPPESFYIVDKILEHKPPGLRWVFVELYPLSAQIDSGERGTAREVYWHDWERTRWACRRAAQSFGAPAPSQRAAARGLIAVHCRLLLKNYANIGRGFDWMKYRKHKKSERWLAQELGPKLDGYLPNPDKPQTAAFRDGMGKLTVKLLKNRGREVNADSLTEQAFAGIAQRIKAANATPVFVIAPTATKLPEYFAGREAPAPVLAFNAPDIFPALYRVGNRHDYDHLNASGAAEFTRLLAERFAASLDERK